MPKLRTWTVHGDGKRVAPDDVVAPEERLAWPMTIGIGMQHVIAMFGATFLVPVLTGFPPTATIFFSGVGTLIFILMTVGHGQRLGLPSYTGSSFAFISPVIAATAGGGMAEALSGIIAAGLVLFLIGVLVDRFGAGWINKLMPPAVTGAIVALIGLNLAPVAWENYQQQPWTATITLTAIVLATVLFRGFWGRISILIGVVIGYLVAFPQGQLSELDSNLAAADWIGLPDFTAPSFSWNAIALIVPVVVVLIAENTGHIKAVASMTDRNLDRSLGRAYMGDGAATMVAGLGGGSGTTTYAENIGVMAATRVYSTAAYVVAGLTAIALGMVPKFGALIVSIPIGVLGGATIILYGLIAVLGGRIWVEARVDFKNPINLFPAAIGLILGAANATWTSASGDVSFNGIAIGSFATIIIYQVMFYVAKYGVNRGVPFSPGTVPGKITSEDYPKPTPTDPNL
ncbi:solute carrier family 23 protein [Fodinibacter luteus]|uniref:Solute carrier family 23 protein n=1 Tax=Fodinibacter luteus TaxID=552064 RepID=A0ABP8K132_9MICO